MVKALIVCATLSGETKYSPTLTCSRSSVGYFNKTLAFQVTSHV